MAAIDIAMKYKAAIVQMQKAAKAGMSEQKVLSIGRNIVAGSGTAKQYQPATKKINFQSAASTPPDKRGATVADLQNQGAGAMTNLFMRTNPFIGPFMQLGDILGGGSAKSPNAPLFDLPLPIPDNQGGFTFGQDPQGNIITGQTVLDQQLPGFDITAPGIPGLPDLFGGLKNNLLLLAVGAIAILALWKR